MIYFINVVILNLFFTAMVRFYSPKASSQLFGMEITKLTFEGS